jgi:nucleotide-binding universal stress UspA family protein
MTCILVATDGSDGGDRAVDYAASEAKKVGCELVIVNIVEGHGLPGGLFERFTKPQSEWFRELLDSVSADILSKARERARKAGAGAIALESRNGEIAHTVVEIANEKGASAIVIGKRGMGQVEGLLLGSVSQKLVSLAPVPVTVVP